MPVLLIAAWLIAPIVLIPLLISRSKKLNKYKAFTEQLHAQGRISDHELVTLMTAVQGSAPQPQTAYQPRPGSHPVMFGPPIAPPQTEFVGPAAPEWHRKNRPPVYSPQQAPVRPAAPVQPASTPVPDFPPRPQPVPQQTAPAQPNAAAFSGYTAGQQMRPPMPAPKPKKERNPASILMGIGAALVVLAGMVLSNAAWLTMGDWGRVGIIALMSLFFFGCCAFSHKKLKLMNTSMAFYLLGSVFAGITFVTMGYFGLIGEWLSVSGEGFWLLYSLAALIITLFMSLAAKVYQKGGFVHAALYGGLVSFTLMSVQVIDDKRWWAFALNLIAAVPVFMLHKESINFGKQEKDPLKLFTVVTATVYALTAIPYMLIDIAGNWELPEILTAFVWFGQAMYYGSVSGSKLLKAAQAAGRIIITAELTCLLVDTGRNDRVMMFSFIVFVMALAWRFIPVIRSEFSDWCDVLSLVIALPVYRIQNDTASFLCKMSIALMITVLMAVNTLEKRDTVSRKAFSVLLPFSTLLSAWTVSSLVSFRLGLEGSEGEMLSFMLPMILICFASAFFFANIVRIRTVVSDFVFPVSLFVCSFVTMNGETQRCFILSTCGFLLLTVLMLMLSSGEDGSAKVMKHLLIFPFVALAFSLSMIPDLHKLGLGKSTWSLVIMSAVLFVFAAGFRYAQLIGADIRTVVSDVGFVGLNFLLGLSAFGRGDQSLAAFMFLMTSVTLVIFIFESKPRFRSLILLERWFFPVTVMFTACSLFSDYELVFTSETAQILYAAFALAVIMLGFDRVHKLRTPFSDFVLPIVSSGVIFYLNDGLNSQSSNGALCAGLLASLVIPAVLVWQGCEKDEGKHLIVHRLFAPLPMVFTASVLSQIFSKSQIHDDAVAGSLLAVTAIAMTAACIFTYLSSRPGSFRGFDHSKYAWSFAAGMFMFSACNSNENEFILLGVVFFSAALYLLCQKHENVLISGFGVIAFCRSAVLLVNTVSGYNDTVLMIAACFISAVLCCGRFLYRDSVISGGQKGTFKLDTAAVGMLITPFIALSCNVGTDLRIPKSIALILAAAFFANLIRPGHTDKSNRVMMTLASGLLCCLVWTRPFLISDEPAVNAKINLIPLILFGVIVRYIWRGSNKLASDMSFAAHVSALGFLLLDALMNQSLANTLFVLITTLVILLISFARKNGRWFAVSGASFLGLTLYITQSFFGRAEWWVYLLAAGIILIVVAAVNEYLKSNGTSIKNEAERFKNRWEK